MICFLNETRIIIATKILYGLNDFLFVLARDYTNCSTQPQYYWLQLLLAHQTVGLQLQLACQSICMWLQLAYWCDGS